MNRLFWWKSTNVGDNVTPYLYEKMTGDKPTYINLRNSELGEHIISTGSILKYANRESLVWGSGFIDKNSKVPEILKVLSVRGPLTRTKLIENGIECPELYGDPGLLVRKFFFPNVEKKYKYGYVPHSVDKEHRIWSDLQLGRSDGTVIDVENPNVEEVLLQILECEIIISSSLHGIVFADAYGIPNVALKISDKVQGSGFKFYDYFDSVQRDRENLLIGTESIIHKISKRLSNYNEPIIDLDKLLSVCPWR